MKKVISGVNSSIDDEITAFRLIKQNKKFIIGN